MGYESVYERELFLTIEKGKVVGKQIVDHTPKKANRGISGPPVPGW
jgi:hypothetical protein